jgi:hypothetical protein
MANNINEIDESTSLEERHYWCTVLIEQGWEARSALEVTGLGVRVDERTGNKECYIHNPTPNRPPMGTQFS